MKLCSVDGCENEHRAQGLCGGHYQRLKMFGDAQASKPLRTRRAANSAAPICSVEGCDTSAICRGWCQTHYKRWKTHGDPTVVLKSGGPRPRKERTIDTNGYVNVYAPDHPNAQAATGRILEHRLVMSQYLDRPLTDDETVHHKNGQRADNRLENLELWAGNHQAGARVEDQLAHARAILQRYG